MSSPGKRRRTRAVPRPPSLPPSPEAAPRANLTESDWRALVELVAQVADRRASHPSEAIYELVEGCGQLVGAVSITATMAIRRRGAAAADPLLGFRPLRSLVSGPGRVRQEQILDEWTALPSNYVEDPMTQRVVAGTGTLRTMTRRQVIDDQSFAGTPAARLLEQFGHTDRMVGARPLHPDVECYLILDRAAPPDFGERERAFVTELLLVSRAPFERWVRAHGLFPDQSPLSPRETEVLGLLLRGLSEKEAADRLSLTVGSTHQYVVSVYRKLGVCSHRELMSRGLCAPEIPRP
ncbi:MAG: helix-turn-helix transcriptional regulator [Deltaproteobacteria bacterium]|nr:helix-turn-helix transcriptional regulator [Deltaproteobacteria bacterium]